jgi:hypothetical protein
MLTQLIFKEIPCNHTIHSFGKGNYCGIEVIILKENGYINASKLCLNAGKNYCDWTRISKAKELIEYYNSHTQECGCVSVSILDVPNELRGTYVHPKLVPHIAMWVSLEFADKVSDIVNGWVIKEYKYQMESKLNKKRIKISDLNEKLDRIVKQNETTLSKLDESNYMLEETLDELVETKDEVIQVSETIDISQTSNFVGYK